jgi:hypothetical protein
VDEEISVNRPRVICELSAYLAVLIRNGLRGEEGEAETSLLESAADIEREGPSPAFFVHLYAIVPDRRIPRASAVYETADEAGGGQRLEIRRPPLWVACRYLVGVRGRSREEEEEMLAALLRTLHDHPTVSPEHLSSIRGEGAVDRIPLELIEERESWLAAGLLRPRPMIAVQATVPIFSAMSDPLQRVLNREIRLEDLG